MELAFDATKNQLDAETTYMQTDEAVRGYFFVTFLCLRVYFGLLRRFRETDKSTEISVEEVFYTLSKVERVIGPGGTGSDAQIPKNGRGIVDLLSEAPPMG